MIVNRVSRPLCATIRLLSQAAGIPPHSAETAEVDRVVHWLNADPARVSAVVPRLRLEVPLDAQAVNVMMAGLESVNLQGETNAAATAHAEFAAADLNRDGVIDGREFAQFLAWQHQRAGRRFATRGDLAAESVVVPDGRLGAAAYQAAETPPTRAQLRRLFVRSMVPMIGFGFIDNFLMLIAGDAIDSSLGSSLHISTLAAAALGNLASDVAGLGLSSSIEAGAGRMGVASPGLTTQQLESTAARLVMLVANIVGITIGCLAGMLPLMFMDSDKREIDAAFSSFATDGSGKFSAADLTVGLQRLGVELTGEKRIEWMRHGNLNPSALTYDAYDVARLLRPHFAQRDAVRPWWQFW